MEICICIFLQDAKESKVIDCKTYNFAGRTGIAILTSNYHFYVANNVEEVSSRRYYDSPGKKIDKVQCFKEINNFEVTCSSHMLL